MKKLLMIPAAVATTMLHVAPAHADPSPLFFMAMTCSNIMDSAQVTASEDGWCIGARAVSAPFTTQQLSNSMLPYQQIVHLAILAS